MVSYWESITNRRAPSVGKRHKLSRPRTQQLYLSCFGRTHKKISRGTSRGKTTSRPNKKEKFKMTSASFHLGPQHILWTAPWGHDPPPTAPASAPTRSQARVKFLGVPQSRPHTPGPTTARPQTRHDVKASGRNWRDRKWVSDPIYGVTQPIPACPPQHQPHQQPKWPRAGQGQLRLQSHQEGLDKA